MNTQVDSDGFIQLWPTQFLQQVLPDNVSANKLLRELILSLEKDHANITTDYLAQNFLSIENPAVEWLTQFINLAVKQYLQKQGIDNKNEWTLQGWPNINRRGDYHSLHNHPHCYLSGTYYIDVPIQTSENYHRNDIAPGSISFFDPRPQANMTAIKGDNQVETEYALLPISGTLLLWPSWLQHFVHPNFSDQPRISMSFNVLMQSDAENLPNK
jgi:uncharacterized protein (TIGR02466 family)